MQTERLLKLADFLEQLPDKKFNINYIVYKRRETCVSVACAIGWMPAVFKELKWEGYDSIVWPDNEELNSIKYNKNFAVARVFFDIDVNLCNYLFDNGQIGYSTTKHVTKRIRKVVKLYRTTH